MLKEIELEFHLYWIHVLPLASSPATEYCCFVTVFLLMWDPVSVSSCVFSVVFQFNAFPEMLIVTLGGILQFPSSLNT